MIKKLLVLVEGVAGSLLVALCVIVFLGVLDRFILGLGYGWTEEVSRFLLIWCTFLSGCIVAGKRGHYALFVVIEVVLGKEECKGRHWANIVLQLFFIFILAVLVIKGVTLTIVMHDTFSPTLMISMSWIYSSIPLSSSIMILIALSEMHSSIRFLQGGGK